MSSRKSKKVIDKVKIKQYHCIMQVTQLRKERKVDYIFDNERPIYIQLVEKLKAAIVSGELKQGERIPSVRELALTARVNPNTMQKALGELEDEGFIYTERTNGKFVADNQQLIDKVKKELAKELVNNYLKDMKNIGINYNEAVEYLQELGGENSGTVRM